MRKDKLNHHWQENSQYYRQDRCQLVLQHLCWGWTAACKVCKLQPLEAAKSCLELQAINNSTDLQCQCHLLHWSNDKYSINFLNYLLCLNSPTKIYPMFSEITTYTKLTQSFQQKCYSRSPTFTRLNIWKMSNCYTYLKQPVPHFKKRSAFVIQKC